MEADHPGGGTADAAAVEVEDGADADHDAPLEMGAQALHEAFLFGAPRATQMISGWWALSWAAMAG